MSHFPIKIPKKEGSFMYHEGKKGLKNQKTLGNTSRDILREYFYFISFFFIKSRPKTYSPDLDVVYYSVIG